MLQGLCCRGYALSVPYSILLFTVLHASLPSPSLHHLARVSPAYRLLFSCTASPAPSRASPYLAGSPAAPHGANERLRFSSFPTAQTETYASSTPSTTLPPASHWARNDSLTLTSTHPPSFFTLFFPPLLLLARYSRTTRVPQQREYWKPDPHQKITHSTLLPSRKQALVPSASQATSTPSTTLPLASLWALNDLLTQTSTPSTSTRPILLARGFRTGRSVRLAPCVAP